MKKALLCFFFALGIVSLSAQTIQVVSPAGCFDDTFNFAIDPTRSPDATGRNVFVQTDVPTTNLVIAFNSTDNRWEIRADGGSFDVYYINTFASTPNPPDSNTSAWDDFGFCDGTGASVVSGDGTQSTLGGCTDPVINDIAFNQTSYCTGDPVVITIDGSLNDAVEWVVYNDAGCGVTEVISSSSNTINIGSRGSIGPYTVYVRGEGGCVSASGDCFEKTFTVESDITVSCATLAGPAIVGADCTSALSDYTTGAFVTVTESCGDDYTLTQYPSPGTLLGPGVYPITMTAVNETGDSDACTITLTVQDATAPSATTPLATINVDCIGDVPDPDPELVTDEADNCGDCPETVWVNEFHYDNAGVDVGEFVEVAGTAGTDLSSYSLYFYDGTTGTVYSTVPLTGIIDDESNGFGAISFPLVGIQDEEPDGFALVKNTTQVLEFWSYDGLFIAADGPAMGMQSTDVGFSEIASAEGNSLQRIGTGNIGPDFTWTGPTTATPGDLNAGQTLEACGGVTVSFVMDTDNGGSGDNGDPLIVTRTYRVTDAAGNVFDVTQEIRAEDTEGPTFVCLLGSNIRGTLQPGECIFRLSDFRSAYVTQATDNCTPTGDLIITQTPALGTEITSGPGSTFTLSFTVQDLAGNVSEQPCSATVLITDEEAPVFDNCPGDQTPTADGCFYELPDYVAVLGITATDNCLDPAEIIFAQDPPAGTLISTTTEVTITATDPNGGILGPGFDGISSTCSFMVNFEGGDPPTITCPPAITVNNDAGQCGAVVTVPAPTVSDGCGINTVVNNYNGGGANASDFYPVGTTTVNFVVTDEKNDADDCSVNITVNDNEAPTASCVAVGTVEVQLDEFGVGMLTAAAVDAGSTDNCPGISLSVSPNSFTCGAVGPQMVTLTVTDAAGNTDVCNTTVSVLSNISIDDIIVTDESCDGAGDGQIEISASGGISLEYSIDGGTTFQPEPLFTALDDGNYDIVVRDNSNQTCVQTATRSIAAGPVCELTAADPCNCLNNASPYDMDTETGGGDGQFSEIVTISADQPLPEGLIFRVIAPTTGVYDVNNVPAEGVQSAGVPVATDGSVTFTYNNGVYELAFVHNDEEGYNMTVILEVEGAQSIGFQLSNTCFYPDPEITSILDGPFCSLSLPITLEGNAGGVDGTGTFYIDGTEITVFDPSLYEPGTYTITYEFDAGEALGYQLENMIVVGPPDAAETLEGAEADPGCIATVVKSIEIIPTPEGYACREQVNVNLQEDCQATLTPESLVGNLECVDLSGYFEINVEDGDESNGATVDGCGTYRYTITGPDGFDCWGFVLAEDKEAPTLDYCPPTIAGIDKNYGYQPFLCDDINKLLIPAPVTYTSDKDGNIHYDDIPSGVRDILDITGYAQFVDNCGDLTITVSDEVVYGYDPNCDDVKIVRTFTAVDACKGLAAEEICTQEIIFTKPDLEDVYCPADVELACDDEFKVDSNGNPHPDVTGYPWLYTAFDLTDDDTENYKSYLNQAFCNLGASYTDGERIEVCAGTYKFVRTWEILDWCREGYERVRECTQVIKIGDNEAPTVVCTEVDYNNDGVSDLPSYSTGPYDCTAAFSVPMPEVTDNCSEWEVLTEILAYSQDGPVVATIAPGASRYVSGIPLGCHFIRYTVTDGCDQKTVVYCPFVVEDRVEPIAVCDDDLNVSIGGQGLARVYADDIDEGSSDNCGPIRIEVRRRILDPEAYECLDMFDTDGDGEVIGDELKLSVQFGDPDGDGAGQEYYYTPWGDYVDFTCCDMDQSVRIELRVWDDRNEDGIPGNEIEKTYCDDVTRDVRDNYNVCWMDLLIEDKLPAYCVPPLPASIDCDALPFDFDPTDSAQMTELFGAASGTDNCPGYTVTELAPLTDGLNDCGYGTLVRRFEVADSKGQTSTNKCEQVITVNERHHYKIKFPKDAEANCGTPETDTIEVEELACDLLAVSVKDDFFSASGDECYKIFRTYSVINWCEYDGISDPVVVNRDEDCDGKPGDEDVWVIVETVNDPDPCYDYYGTTQADYYSHVWYDRDNDPFNLLPKAGTKGESCDYETNPTGFWKEVYPITENEDKDSDNYPAAYYGDHCEDMASVGYWQYTQVIKVYDNINPIVEFTAPDPFCTYSSDLENDCPAEVSIDFTINENCTPDDLTVTIYLDAFADGLLDGDITDLLTGTYPNYNVTGDFPIGSHALGVSVKDGCGNEVGVNIPFEVVDCKAPTPVCINGLAIELMPVIPAEDIDGDGDLDNGAMAIWASDFVASPVADCSGEVKYSINRVGEEVDADQTGITLTCDDDASLLVEIWAWDALGNGDFCETYILVQDNMVNCTDGGNGGLIAGMVTNEDLDAIAGVDVALSGSDFQNMVTPNDGHYQFSDLATGFDYTVTPHMDRTPLNGVSTFDLVLMSKHILGTQLLDSPYKMIAADVNNSKTITTLDAIQLRRLVLNIDIKFGNNTSWRFIPRAYQFPDPSKPWSPAFPEVININNLQGVLDNQDFVAVKIGDLNLSSNTNAFVSTPRNIVGSFFFDVADQELKEGETYRIDFRAKDLARIQGYQMTLQMDPAVAAVADIHYGIAQAVNFGTRAVREGMITTSWNAPGDGMASYDPDALVFSLSLEARTDARLSEILRISNRITVAEAYDQDDQLLDVGINFGTGTVNTAGFELYQNVPNPFRDATQIGFYLPESSEVSLRIYDVSGRTLKLIRGEFSRGLNQVTLTRSELGAAGMLYYTLTAGEHTASRKMMVIE
ncbi:HYR domain-containing protein [Flavilitoribacter nigricans]|uniref:HYR domain-containing protein n=1 Tax=Flavilitoribacter nigricans (strain ATCC 23147 / DSM 23189 / NBRC 102662 / NCIMB 1420 / SS-2) TaxID=1122177 RepID=A0A2D0NFZ8_FLAN2|nr:HYR domain-containing protein [Flavilitoribacter nigricans]PHN06703.1 hypothetical protein CRP01_10425 [Flavilitoribacter nigricans DSM 23189 = NBRC 102662]